MYVCSGSTILSIAFYCAQKLYGGMNSFYELTYTFN